MVRGILLRPPLFGGHGPDPCPCLRADGLPVETTGLGGAFLPDRGFFLPGTLDGRLFELEMGK